MNNKILALAAFMAAGYFAPAVSNAALVLDTGTPAANATAVALDANDFYAAEFSLAGGSTVTAIQAYLTNSFFADSPGDTFTLSIYQDNNGNFLGNRGAAPVFSTQGTYTADGWNGASGLSWTASATGNYWAAIEINPPGDTAVQLGLLTPTTGGTAAALAFAFNDGSGNGYSSANALPFAIQVTATAPVPLPAGLWLLGSGLTAMAAAARRRRPAN
jgi:hypothetical protein